MKTHHIFDGLWLNLVAIAIIITSMRPNAYSQNCDALNITPQSDIASTCAFMTMSMMHDQLDRPYLYVANKEAGLKIYNISNLSAPSLVNTIPITSFNSLEVINLTQDGNYVYLSIGNIFNSSGQHAGIAIIDVTNPIAAFVTDFWELQSSQTGAGIVKVEGNYAYLGAMRNGLVILDITNKNNIQFVSQFVPDIHFPPIANPDSAKINARGMEVKNSIVYLCYDAGGFRIINCTNKFAPFETGHYCNPIMYTPFDLPRAYNNVIIDDTLAYIAVDYCGMEVLNISDTSNITLLGWWNPYNCPSNNWFNSPIHANEIHYNSLCKQIFLSTGKSDLLVIDVSNPALPDSCNFYGGVSNSIGTWGVGLYQNEIYLSYICALIPFSSNWTGIKILTYTPCIAGIDEENEKEKISIYPNPTNRKLSITFPTKDNGQFELKILNIFGQQVLKQQISNNIKTTTLDMSQFAEGIYFVHITTNKKINYDYKVIVAKLD